MTSVPPTQPPAAPETDVRLTEAERDYFCGNLRQNLGYRAWVIEDTMLGHVERIVAERVRVVEGERDAAQAREDYVGTEHVRLEEAYGVQADLLAEATARAESAEAAHANVEADYDRRGERLWRLAAKAGYVPTESDNDATAEMAVADVLAAHRALQAAVETLAEKWEGRESHTPGASEHAAALRALLAGGGAR